jgi:hypothetical protein
MGRGRAAPGSWICHSSYGSLISRSGTTNSSIQSRPRTVPTCSASSASVLARNCWRRMRTGPALPTGTPSTTVETERSMPAPRVIDWARNTMAPVGAGAPGGA